MMEFLEHMKTVRKVSDRTLKRYHQILREFQHYEPITPRSWTRFLSDISNQSPSTQALKIKITKAYLNWKANHGLIRDLDKHGRFWNEARPPRSKPLPKYLTKEEIKRLLDVIDEPYYKALFKLLANSGLRIGEALSLTPDNVILHEGSARLRVRGKGNKEREIPINRMVLEEAIKAGIFEKKVSARQVERKMKQYLKRAGINKDVSPHSLRHSYAILLLEIGRPINVVKKRLGHESLATTGIYTEIIQEDLEEEILVG